MKIKGFFCGAIVRTSQLAHVYWIDFILKRTNLAAANQVKTDYVDFVTEKHKYLCALEWLWMMLETSINEVAESVQGNACVSFDSASRLGLMKIFRGRMHNSP